MAGGDNLYEIPVTARCGGSKPPPYEVMGVLPLTEITCSLTSRNGRTQISAHSANVRHQSKVDALTTFTIEFRTLITIFMNNDLRIVNNKTVI